MYGKDALVKDSLFLLAVPLIKQIIIAQISQQIADPFPVLLQKGRITQAARRFIIQRVSYLFELAAIRSQNTDRLVIKQFLKPPSISSSFHTAICLKL